MREVFKCELAEKNIGTSTMMFAANDITDLVEPPEFRAEVMNSGVLKFCCNLVFHMSGVSTS